MKKWTLPLRKTTIIAPSAPGRCRSSPPSQTLSKHHSGGVCPRPRHLVGACWRVWRASPRNQAPLGAAAGCSSVQGAVSQFQIPFWDIRAGETWRAGPLYFEMCATGTYYWYLLRTNYLPGINHRFQCINSFFIRININILFLSLCTKVRFPIKSDHPFSQVVGMRCVPQVPISIRECSQMTSST